MVRSIHNRKYCPCGRAALSNIMYWNNCWIDDLFINCLHCAEVCQLLEGENVIDQNINLIFTTWLHCFCLVIFVINLCNWWCFEAKAVLNYIDDNPIGYVCLLAWIMFGGCLLSSLCLRRRSAQIHLQLNSSPHWHIISKRTYIIFSENFYISMKFYIKKPRNDNWELLQYVLSLVAFHLFVKNIQNQPSKVCITSLLKLGWHLSQCLIMCWDSSNSESVLT